MKVSEILDLDWVDINRMDEKELRSVANTLRSASNKRIKRVTKEFGTNTPALKALQKRQGRTRGVAKFTISDVAKMKDSRKRMNALRSKIVAMRGFIKNKTSSLKGARAYRRQLDEMTKGLTKRQKTAMFKAYSRFMEDGNMKEIFASDAVFSWVKSYTENHRKADTDDILNAMYQEAQYKDQGTAFQTVADSEDEETDEDDLPF